MKIGLFITIINKNEINNLDNIKKEIFIKLEKDSEIIINGKKYKSYDIIPKDENWNK